MATPGWGRVGRVALLALGVALVAAGCGKSKAHTNSPTPSSAETVPAVTASAVPSLTATLAPPPSPSPAPSPKPSPKPSAKPGPTPTSTVTPTVQITQPSGSTLSVKAGSSLNLTLAVEPGYAWQVTTQPTATVLAVASTKTFSPSPAPASSTATPASDFRITFTAVAPGTTTFALQELATGNPQAIRMYALTVVVTAS